MFYFFCLLFFSSVHSLSFQDSYSLLIYIFKSYNSFFFSDITCAAHILLCLFWYIPSYPFAFHFTNRYNTLYSLLSIHLLLRHIFYSYHSQTHFIIHSFPDLIVSLNMFIFHVQWLIDTIVTYHQIAICLFCIYIHVVFYVYCDIQIKFNYT